VFGVLLLVQALRGGWQPAEERDLAIDWRAIAWVAAGLALNAALIVPLGFTLSSALMFTVIARGFGSSNLLRDAGIGVALSLIAYFGFAKALGVSLGQGPLERLLGG
jgi:putative tricarboxylic transport membrane protein